MLIAIFIVCGFVLTISLYWENIFDLNTKEKPVLISADFSLDAILNEHHESVAPQTDDNDIRPQKIHVSHGFFVA